MLWTLRKEGIDMFFTRRPPFFCKLNNEIPVSTPLSDLTFTVFDTETTGFKVRSEDRLIEIGAVNVKGFEVLENDTFQTYVNPYRHISREITELTGISQEDVEQAPASFNAIQQFFSYTERNESICWIGHYIDFDLLVLKEECRRADFSLQKHLALDTLDLIGEIAPSFDMRDLERYAMAFSTRIYPRHSAVGDALTTAFLFVELLWQLNNRGYQTWGDLLRFIKKG